MTERNRYHIQVVGGGPAGTGLFVLEAELLRASVALINTNRHLGAGGLPQLQIKSNSVGGDFLDGVEGNPVLRSLLTSRSAKQIARFSSARRSLVWRYGHWAGGRTTRRDCDFFDKPPFRYTLQSWNKLP